MTLNCLVLSTILSAASLCNHAMANDCSAHLDYSAKRLHMDEHIDFCDSFEDKVLLVVNTASQCGFTPQFDGLEALYQKYKDHGLAIVGFPSADFQQELAQSKDIAQVCYINYGVTFPMLSESSVTGENANPFFQQLINQTGQSPRWNFNKYLISKDGMQVKHFSSSAAPEGGSLEKHIQDALALRQ